jgi:hypothetical protein
MLLQISYLLTQKFDLMLGVGAFAFQLLRFSSKNLMS